VVKTFNGYMLIADITGYTMYLSKSELEHAQGTLTALLELLIDHTRPPLVISRLAGDAVISYGLQEDFFQGQSFIELIESTYIAFRKAIERMVLNNTCRCKACANISSLDLKFFVHFGAFVIQRISDHDELVGSDVNLIHRLLKNHVSEITGWNAYALYTAASIQQLGLESICASMLPHSEEYEHLGTVEVWIQDMHPVWEEKKEAARITIPPREIALQLETEIAAPPEKVWDFIVLPQYRRVIIGSDRQEIINRRGGRVVAGSVYQCFHGDQLILETVLEWQPFERIVTQDLIPIPIPNTSLLVEHRLEAIDTGTRLIEVWSKAKGPLIGRLMVNRVAISKSKGARKALEGFKQLVESELAAKASDLPAGSSISPQMVSEEAAASLQRPLD
jgi:uncharacterized protein YndB with AHSA1/START domain